MNPEELRQSHSRFYGRLDIDENAPLWEQIGGNIEGMSGGPVLGISHGADGLRYWVIGIQSGWLRSQRIIAACNFQAFARYVGEELDEAIRDSDSLRRNGPT
jgi:hypothetical protein